MIIVSSEFADKYSKKYGIKTLIHDLSISSDLDEVPILFFIFTQVYLTVLTRLTISWIFIPINHTNITRRITLY